jgi:hypothetical protein
VKSFTNAPLYDAQTLRTVFLEFENADWEKELAELKNTDVNYRPGHGDGKPTRTSACIS